MDSSGAGIRTNPRDTVSVAVGEGRVWRVSAPLLHQNGVFWVAFPCLIGFPTRKALRSCLCFSLIQRRGCLRPNSHGRPVALSTTGPCAFVDGQRDAMAGSFNQGKMLFEDLYFYSHTQVAVMVSSSDIQRLILQHGLVDGEVNSFRHTFLVKSSSFNVLLLDGRQRKEQVCTHLMEAKGILYTASVGFWFASPGSNKVLVQHVDSATSIRSRKQRQWEASPTR